MQNDNNTSKSIALATSPPVVIPNSTAEKTPPPINGYSGLFFWIQST